MSAAKKSLSFSCQEWLILLAILGMAFAIRTHNLEARSLWVDEGISLHRSQQKLLTLLNGAIPIDGGTISDPTPPLHSILLAVLQWTAGDSVFGLRLLSVWLGLIGLAILFVLGRRLFGRTGGLAAVFLGALSPYWVWYDQAARPDSLLLTSAILSVLALHRMLKPHHFSHRRGALWALATALMLYSHQGALWVLAFELVVVGWIVVRHPNRYGRLLWLGLALLAALPLMGKLWNGQDLLTNFRPSWDQARQLVTAVNQESPGLAILRLLPTAMLLMVSSIWLLRYPRRTRAALFSAGYLLVPVIASYLIAYYLLKDSEPRYLVVTLAPMYLLQGAGAAALWRRWRPLASLTLIGAALIMSQWLYVQTNDPTFTEDDLSTAASYAASHAQADDVIVLHNALIQPIWNYYYAGAAAVEIVPHYNSQTPDLELARLENMAAEHDQVWFLYRPLPADSHDPDLFFDHAETEWVKFDQQSFSSPWLETELAIYAAEPPVVETLPANAVPAEHCWLTGLCLHGWSAENWSPGENAQITLYWSQNNPTEDHYQLGIHLQDADQQQWLEHTKAIFPFYPAGRWPSGQMLAQSLEISLSPALPITDFLLELEVLVSAETVPYRVSTNAGHNRVTLGQISLSRPAEPIAAEELQLQYQSNADFGDVVRFLGYNLPADTPRPGHTTFIDLYWQTLAAPTESWQQRIQLIGADEQIWTETMEALGPSQFDLLQWRTGDLVWERVFLALPGQMPAGEYKIQVTLLNADVEPVPAKEIWRAELADSIIAGPAYLDPWPLLTEHPPMPHQPDTIFGGARLWGYEIEGQVRPGNTLNVTLVWRDELPIEEDYAVFVHLMNKAELLLAQSDGVPAHWTRPTSSWRPGEFIVDQHQLSIPADAPAGPVYLWVGLYNGNGRVSVSNAPEGQPADRVLLDILVVEP